MVVEPKQEGDKLIEASLANQLNMNHTPVRIAARRLVHEVLGKLEKLY